MSINRELSEQAKLFVADIARDLHTKEALNANQYFLMGRTLLDKDAFNRINDDGFEPVHGFSVIYGPFDSKTAAHEFVAEYPEEKWPGHNDWVLVHPGKPHILTHHFDPTNADVVHNKTHEFQGQYMVNEMQRRMEEMAEVKQMAERAEKQEELTKEQIEGLKAYYMAKIDVLDKKLQE